MKIINSNMKNTSNGIDILHITEEINEFKENNRYYLNTGGRTLCCIPVIPATQKAEVVGWPQAKALCSI
jgi:hypothetical protein